MTALRAFEATARLSGFSAAARELNVTHAAVAQQVRALEEHFRVPLVQRDGRNLRLTEEGRFLSAALTEGFRGIRAACDTLAQGLTDRPLRVTMTPSFAVQWLIPRLGRFWEKHPDVEISMHPEHRVVDLVREGMDLAIRFGTGNWPGYDVQHLVAARYMVVGAPSLLGDRHSLTPAEMTALPWVIEEDWPEEASWLRSIGIDPEAIEVTPFPNEELALAAARQGFGLHIESAALIEDDLKADRLRAVFQSTDPTPAYYIVTPPGQPRKLARQFIAWLRESV
ncbi:MAG: LysR family transcriptional regulator [Pseudomonadota bacterium]